MKKYVFTLLLFFFFQNVDLNSVSRVFSPQECLDYDIYFNWGIIWIKAATATLSVQEKDSDFIFRLSSSTTKTFNLYKVRDTLVSYVNKRTLEPRIFYQLVHEDDYHVDFKFSFYQKEFLHGVSVEKNKSGTLSTTEYIDETSYYDVLSTFYRLRDFAILNPSKMNEKIPMRMVFSDGIYNLYWKYTGNVRVKLKNKKVYDCHEIKPAFADGKLFSKGEVMTLWVTNDKNRIPVMMEAKMKVGSIKIMLTGSKNLLFPLSSEVK